MSVVQTRRQAASGPVSLSYWSDEWKYHKLLESVNVKTVHQKEREEQEAEKKAKEAEKRLNIKVAAAQNRQRAILEKKKSIDLELVRRGRKHKKRAAKKAAKKDSDSLMKQIDQELDEVDLEALEEELRALEEEEEIERNATERVERKSTEEERNVEGGNSTEVDGVSELFGTQSESREFEFLDMETDRDRVGKKSQEEKSGKTLVNKSKNKCRYRKSASGKYQAQSLTNEDLKGVKEHEKRNEKEINMKLADQDMLRVIEDQSLNAAKELLIEKRRLMAEEEEKLIIDEAKKSARKELNKMLLNNLKSKAEEAKVEVTRTVKRANDAYDDASIYMIEVARDEREAVRTAAFAKAAAEKAKIAAERFRLSQKQYAALQDYEEAMKYKAQIAKETYETFVKDIEKIERVENEMSIKVETENIERPAVVVNPFLDFIKESISCKSQDLECPVCLDEATSPIYSCPTRGHILCSSCRPAVSWCPECRESLGTERIIHRFAERTADELKGLREKLQSI